MQFIFRYLIYVLQIHYIIPKYVLLELILSLTKGQLCLFNSALSLPTLRKWEFEDRYTFVRFCIFIIMHSSQVEPGNTRQMCLY